MRPAEKQPKFDAAVIDNQLIAAAQKADLVGGNDVPNLPAKVDPLEFHLLQLRVGEIELKLKRAGIWDE